MGVSTFSSNYVTGEGFRAWVSAWITGWTAAGLAQASDSGQADPSTVTPPTTVNTYPVKAVFFLNDALHATAPIYIVAEFGMSNALNYPDVAVTVCRGTDGAGTPTGVLIPRTSLGARNTTMATPYTHLASCGDGWFAFMANTDYLGNSAYLNLSLIVERSRLHDGTPSPHGLMVVMGRGDFYSTLSSATGLPYVWSINYTSGANCYGGPPVTAPYKINNTVLGPGTSLAMGSIGPVFPWVLFAPGIAPWQSLSILSIPGGDFPGGVFETTLCGDRRRFRAVPVSDTHRWGVSLDPVSVSGSSMKPSTYIAGAIRWEE